MGVADWYWTSQKVGPYSRFGSNRNMLAAKQKRRGNIPRRTMLRWQM